MKPEISTSVEYRDLAGSLIGRKYVVCWRMMIMFRQRSGLSL
jgi:hypothetical protein